MSIQLDFFEERTEIEVLEDRIKELEEALTKQRKSLYAKYGELYKRYVELSLRVDILERNICKGKKVEMSKFNNYFDTINL